jgi:hypothetical protein
MTFREMYRLWVGVAESKAHARDLREQGLRDLAARTPTQGQSMVDGDPSANAKFRGDALVASDMELKDLQGDHDRAVQVAIMYGLGALMEATNGQADGVREPRSPRK